MMRSSFQENSINCILLKTSRKSGNIAEQYHYMVMKTLYNIVKSVCINSKDKPKCRLSMCLFLVVHRVGDLLESKGALLSVLRAVYLNCKC